MSGVSVPREEGVPERGALQRRAGPSSTWPTRSANLSEHTVSPRSSGRVEICGGSGAGGWARAGGAWCADPPPAPAAAHLQQQHGGGAGPERGLQQARELRVAEGHVRPAGAQRGHHASQGQQRAVDSPGLPQALGALSVPPRRACRPCLPGTLGSGQVHQVQRACGGERARRGGGPGFARSEAPRPARARAAVPAAPGPRGGDAVRSVSVTRACDRELCGFLLVAAVARLLLPRLSIWRAGRWGQPGCRVCVSREPRPRAQVARGEAREEGR